MILLGLGSNLDKPQEQLKLSHLKLEQKSIRILNTSYSYQNPAFLKLDAPNEWQKNFVNQVLSVEFAGNASQLLQACKQVENEMGRQEDMTWGPRPIDIDILYFHGQIIETDELKIPHPGFLKRHFVLAPAIDIAPHLVVDDKKLIQHYRSLKRGLSKWMGIINLTPDSFSDGGSFANVDAALNRIDQLIHDGAHIIDLGAESTRPGAEVLNHQQEWQRLEPILKNLDLKTASFSIDTYHPETAEKAIEMGVKIINDVGGLQNQRMKEVFKQSDVTFVCMHQLGLPADPNMILKEHPIEQVYHFFEEILTFGKERLWLDPGIGFGKSAVHSRYLIASLDRFFDFDLPLVVGHSRKSFMKGITAEPAENRDLETVAISMILEQKKVDVIRVHDVQSHIRASLMQNSVETCF